MQPFDASNLPTRVVFGPGTVASLPDLLAGLGTHRSLVVCGKTVAGGPMLARVRAAL